MKVAKYWAGIGRIAIDEPACFACGMIRRKWGEYLQRAHVVPRALGGTDSPQNIVLLCDRCHRESPDCTNPRHMHSWIDSRSQALMELTFGTTELLRALADLGCSDIANERDDWSGFSAWLLGPGRNKFNTHGARITASTLAAMLIEYHNRVDPDAQHKEKE